MERGESDAVRCTAAKELLDRGFGKPSQDNTHTINGQVNHVFMAMPPVARDAAEWLENHRKSIEHV